MKTLTLQLTVTVTYSREDGEELSSAETQQLKDNLDYLPQYAAGNGVLTDEAFEVVVGKYNHEVKTIV